MRQTNFNRAISRLQKKEKKVIEDFNHIFPE